MLYGSGAVSLRSSVLEAVDWRRRFYPWIPLSRAELSKRGLRWIQDGFRHERAQRY
jgi:hypothetical protein